MSRPKLAHMEIAERYVGEREIEGALHNPLIIKMFKSTSYHAESDETPWCAAFINAVLEEAGIKGTYSARAKSFLNWGEVVGEPQYGDLVILHRGNNPAQGHVTFFVRWTDSQRVAFEGLGGNQSNSVRVSTYRVRDANGKTKIAGYRRPNVGWEKLNTRVEEQPDLFPEIETRPLPPLPRQEGWLSRLFEAILNALGIHRR